MAISVLLGTMLTTPEDVEKLIDEIRPMVLAARGKGEQAG